MQFGEIRRKKSQWELKKDGQIKSQSADSVTLEILNNKADIRKAQIDDVTQEYSQFAFNSGYTNDTETYSNTMSTEIFETFKDVAERQLKRKKAKK